MNIGKVLMGIGLILIGIAFLTANLTINENYTKKQVYLNKDEIQKIKINVYDHNIIVEESLTNKISITYYVSKNDLKEYYIKDRQASLISNKRAFNLFNFNFKNYPVIIKIPKNIVLDIDLRTSNGYISLDNLDFNKTNIKTSNGKIILRDITFNNTILKTSNGEINLNNIIGKEINLATSNGRINLNYVDVIRINANTSNGKIAIDKLKSDDIKLSTSNGSVSGSIIGDEMDYNMSLKTSNGNIYINDKK